MLVLDLPRRPQFRRRCRSPLLPASAAAGAERRERRERGRAVL